MPRSLWLAALLTLAAAPVALAGPRIEAHDLEVVLTPASARIEGRDTLTVLREGGGSLEFRLNVGLDVREAFLDDRAATGLERIADDGWTATWRVDVTPGPGPRGRLVLRYDGVIADATRGVVGVEGVQLPADSGWYPADGGLARHSVRARVPAPYTVVSQGTRVGVEDGWSSWRPVRPAAGLSLVAGRWQRFERKSGAVTVGAYLSGRSAGRAERLLDAAVARLAQYRSLLGTYPYERFDIVENWLDARRGAPGFVLLPRHEIAAAADGALRDGSGQDGGLDLELANAIVRGWWGHAVQVGGDSGESGDWSAGLASFCADYLPLEGRSAAAARALRERTNVAFAIEVEAARDVPLRDVPPGSADVAVGKSRMVFHMLRREIGDAAFDDTLRRVARERAGTRISWRDWQQEFEESSRRNLGAFFDQWLDRSGGPRLALANVRLVTQGGRMRVSGELTQSLAPGEEPWRVAVPLVVELLDGREHVTLDLSGQATPFSILVPTIPLRVTADPDHHVFRRLHPDEIPPCLAATLRQGPLVVYPDGDTVLRAAAERAAEMAAQEGATVVPASEASATPPRGGSVLVFGDEGRVPLLATLRRDLAQHFPSAAAGPGVTILASARNPADTAHFVTTFVGPAGALAAHARAAYEHAYDGLVTFEDGVARERGPVAARSRTARFVLPDLRGAEDVERIEKVLGTLVAAEMDGRLAGSAGEAAARKLVVSALRIAGLDVREQPFAFEVRRSTKLHALRRGAEAIGGCHPLVASPLTPAPGLPIGGIVENDAPHVQGRGVLLDLPAGTESPLQFVRGAAALASARGAAALLLRVPAETPRRIAELWETPETLLLRDDAAEGLIWNALRGEGSDTLMHAARTAARIGSDERLPLPVVAVPHDFVPSEAEHVVQVAFDPARIESANVIARLRPDGRPASRGPQRGAGAIVVGAHLDHLGPGFPGADDASGVAAVLEAAQILSVNQDLLGREVHFVFFGAHEWGLRGSRAFCANLRPGTRPAACINADGVGRRGLVDIDVLGSARHPRLGRLVAAALGRASVPAGAGSGLFEYVEGSDHWPFHELGVASVTLSAGARPVRRAEDTLDSVSPTRVKRVARALALAALAASIGL